MAAEALTPEAVFNQLNDTFSDYELTYDENVPCIIVPANAIRDVAMQLRDAEEYAFDYLMSLSGVDNGDETLGVVYHLYSFTYKNQLTLKVIVPKEDPKLKSVARIWLTADWHEREAYDLVGMTFEGHPDHRRILMPYDWEGHPLRKDYEVPEFYNGMKVPY
ncbi:MAG: NADH-quinone oxidoreductase subunit C [Ectothiorhodospiraceae bacterium]|nr:NADH-quinone oxidoreductase subunit C [Ectothiorhodospiraceae bacterium]